ncbi:hypothetical protein ACF0H5_019383 [Mactra antiquata]
MVRTKADAGGSSGSRKAVGGNAPRKALGGAGPSCDSASPSGKSGKYAGGNPVCPRPTPEWQKGIGGFLSKKVVTKDKENTIPNDDIEILESSSSKAGSSKDVEPGNSNADS